MREHPFEQAMDERLLREDEITLRDRIRPLWLRRRLFLVIVLLITVIGVTRIFQLEEEYTATATLMIGLPDPQVVDVKAVVAGSPFNDATLRGEIEVLRSRGLGRRIVEEFGLHRYPEFNPGLSPPDWRDGLDPMKLVPRPLAEALGMGSETSADSETLDPEEIHERDVSSATSKFLDNLSVSPISNSNVVRIQFTSQSPEIAARVADALPETYIVSQLEAKLAATEKATRWLDEQLEELKEKVLDSERAVEIYRKEHDLEGSPGQGTLGEQNSQITSQLVIAKAARAEAEARYRKVSGLIDRNDPESLEGAAGLVSSALVQNLKIQETEALQRVAELSVEYGPKHPRMIQASAEVVDLRSKIDEEIRKIAGGLKNDYELALARERSLQESLDELEEQFERQNTREIQLRALQREASANRALFETFLSRFKETSTTREIQQADARVVSEAEVPRVPSYPDRKRQFGQTLLVAIAIGIAVVYLLEALHNGLLTPEQVEDEIGIPTLGMVPLVASRKPHDLAVMQRNPRFGESINTLRTSLMLSDPDRALKIIQVTSSVPEEGKSTLAIAIARNLARSGTNVVLVETDLRRSVLQKRMGIGRHSPGLTDFIMQGGSEIEDYFVRDTETDLAIMPRGRSKFISAQDVLASRRMEALMGELRQRFDFVICDSPPSMVVSDARILGRLADTTVMVVRWNKTPKNVVKATIGQLRSVGVDVAGVVLQRVNLKRVGSYGYGESGHYYHYRRYGRYYAG